MREIELGEINLETIPINYRCPEDNPKKMKMVITMEKKKQCKHCKAWNHPRSDFCLECGSLLPFR